MTNFEADPQHSPMSGLDEYLVHNHPHPVRVMWTSDPKAYERVWFAAHEESGALLVVCGLAVYPNLGTAEAFAIVNHEGRHTTVRAHRRLGDDRMNMTVGPLTLAVVRPFREWRLKLGQNDHGISFDISWFDTTRAVYRNLGAGSVVGGIPFAGVAGFDGLGTATGWVEVSGERFPLDRDRWLGSRDHHWGTRDGVGGRANWSGFQHAVSGAFVRFPEWALWVDHLPRDLDDAKRGSAVARRVRHRLSFEPDIRLVSGGELDVEMPDGSTRTLLFRRMGNQIAFLRCAMYGGPNGGTPDDDIWQGQFVGDGVIRGETFDVNDPGVRASICGLDQHHMRFECDGVATHGLYEAYDTLAYEVAGQNRQGLSLLQSG